VAATPPTTDEVRPTHCVACGCASRPAGGPLAVHGHGGRDRWVLGVLGVGAPAGSVVVSGRRYACQRCGCVMLVVPRELSPRRRYALVAIALALGGFGAGESATSLRARLAPGTTFEAGWASLRRWVRAAAAGKLFRWIRGVSELAGRVLAERVSVVLAEASGRDVRSASFEARVFAGVMSSSGS
jgi:hypothetical protein